jgi:hypothetical protein
MRRRSRLRDWFFGGPGKRRLLLSVVAEPERTWTQTELARAASLGTKGSVDEHLLVLVQLRLLTENAGRYALNKDSPILTPLRDLLSATEQLPDEDVRRP